MIIPKQLSRTAPSHPSVASGESPSTSHLWLAMAFGLAALLWAVGAASPASIGDNLNLEPIFVLLALDRFADLLAQTNALAVLATRAARATRGRRSRMSFLFVGYLLVAGTVNNNITTCLLVLPAVTLTLRAIEANDRTTRTVGALVLAAGNVAGASTPTGDFPALLLLAAGAISYRDYLTVGTPLFLLTALVLAVVYRKLLHDADPGVAKFGFTVLSAAQRHQTVNIPALRRLALVFGAMVAAWLMLDPGQVSPAVIAWAGLAVAGAVTSSAGLSMRLDSVEMRVAIKLAAILLGSAALAGTGVVARIGTEITGLSDSPLPLLLMIMALTTVAAGVADASAAAAALLPLLLSLTQKGQPLAACAPLAVIGYAAAVCAGSSLWTSSATAGQLLEHRLTGARLTDPSDGRPIRFTWRSYAPLGAMNCALQLAVATAYVCVFAFATGVA